MTATDRLSLLKSLAVSTLAVWIASLICFYFLEFHDGMLPRTLGFTAAYFLVGSAYPLVVAFPLSKLVLNKRPAGFVSAFTILFFAAIVLMTLILALVPGAVGGYAAGVLAISFLGFGISYYIGRKSICAMVGLLLGCWTFPGDYLGHNLKNLLSGSKGMIVYASIYSVFLGSGLGALLWYVQRTRTRPAEAGEVGATVTPPPRNHVA